MKNSNQLLFPAILVVAAALILYLFVRPAYATVQDLKEVRSDYDKALASAQKLTKKIDLLHMQVNSFPPKQVERFHRFLPDHFNNVLFILILKNIASQHNLELENVGFSGDLDIKKDDDGKKSDEDKGIHTASVRFNISGDYETLVSFLKDIERSLRIMDVQSVSFTTRPVWTPGTDHSSDYSISVKTYWISQ